MSWLGLEGKVAVVTGAASGIGAAVALELARNGALVAVLDINAADAEATSGQATALGPDAFAVRVDTTDVGTATRAPAVIRPSLRLVFAYN